jgi:D-alanyl-D-alanine carboxypeptidase
MASNGRLPSSMLRPIPGGRLEKDAAASWLRLRQRIGQKYNIWICPTSSRTAYRTYSEQVYFWNLYRSGRGALAAYPGTSNHGWGTTVDVPSTYMAQLINREGAEYGWQKRWSDAPSEWWHFRYAPQYDRHKGERAKPKPKGRKALRKDERKHRDGLVKARARYREHNGWTSREHKRNAQRHKAWLRRRRRAIRKAGFGEGHYRSERYKYIGKLIGAK